MSKFLKWLRQRLATVAGATRRPEAKETSLDLLGTFVDEQGREVRVLASPPVHGALTPEQLERVARLADALAEVYPLNREEWVDGFLRDLDPERELSILEAVAVAYQHFTAAGGMATGDKKRLYGALLTLSGGADPADLEPTLRKGADLPSAAAMTAFYHEALATGRRP